MIYDLSSHGSPGGWTHPDVHLENITPPQRPDPEAEETCANTHVLLLVQNGLVCLYWDGELITVCSAGEWVLCRDAVRSRFCPYGQASKYCCLNYGGRNNGHALGGKKCLFAQDAKRIYFRGRISPSLRSSVKILCADQNDLCLTDVCYRNETMWRVLGCITGEVQGTLPSRSADSLIVTEEERGKLEKMRQFLETNPGEECKLCELCQRFSLRPCLVKSTFKACYGETVFGYWKGVKLDHARRMLESGSCNVTEAALAIGYDNPSHFAAAFRKRFGSTPKRYQIKHKILRAEA